MQLRALLPLLAFLPLGAAASVARADDGVTASAADKTGFDTRALLGDWTIRADDSGCQRVVSVGEDNVITFADGGGSGTWVVHGDTLQINVQHAKVPIAEAGLGARKHVAVRWTGALRKGDKGVLVGELTIDVLGEGGKAQRTRKAKFTATRS